MREQHVPDTGFELPSLPTLSHISSLAFQQQQLDSRAAAPAELPQEDIRSDSPQSDQPRWHLNTRSRSSLNVEGFEAPETLSAAGPGEQSSIHQGNSRSGPLTQLFELDNVKCQSIPCASPNCDCQQRSALSSCCLPPGWIIAQDRRGRIYFIFRKRRRFWWQQQQPPLVHDQHAHDLIRRQHQCRRDWSEQRFLKMAANNAVAPSDLNRLPSLDFLPASLGRNRLSMLLVFYLSLAIGLFYLALLRGPDGSSRTTAISYEVQLLARYGPTVLGTITRLSFLATVDDLMRLMPYFLMARDGMKGNKAGATARESLSVENWPWIIYGGYTWQALALLSLPVRFVAGFLTALKVGLFVITSSGSRWNVSTNSALALLCALIYVTLAAYIAAVALWLENTLHKTTGLRWDVTCLADFASLFHGSSALVDFADLADYHKLHAKRLLRSSYRLAYWQRLSPESVQIPSLGIRKTVANVGESEEAAESTQAVNTDEQSCDLERSSAVTQDAGPPESPRVDAADTAREALRTEASEPANSQTGREDRRISSSVERDHADHEQEHPTPVRSSLNEKEDVTSMDFQAYETRRVARVWRVIWSIFWTLVLLAGASLIVTAYAIGTNRHGLAIDHRFGSDHLNATVNYTSSTSGESANHTSLSYFDNITTPLGHDLWVDLLFLRMIPTFLAGQFGFGFIVYVMNRHAFNKPLLNMARNPTSASNSILLNYYSGSTLTNLTEAWAHSHWLILYVSALAAVSSSFPIVVGAIIAEASDDGTRILFTLSPAALGATLGFIAVYLATMPLIWPSKEQQLVHPAWNIAHCMSLCWAARFVHMPELDIAHPSVKSKEHFVARVLLADLTFRYGVYDGNDRGKDVGFDAVSRGDVAVTKVQEWTPSRRTNMRHRLGRVFGRKKPLKKTVAHGLRQVTEVATMMARVR